MADPDHQIRGGRSSRPWDKRGGRSHKKMFRPFRPQFGLKIRGAPPPGSATERDRDASRKIGIKTLKKTNLGVWWLLLRLYLTPKKDNPRNELQGILFSYICRYFLMPTLNDSFKDKNFSFQSWTLQQRAESAISTSIWHDDHPCQSSNPPPDPLPPPPPPPLPLPPLWVSKLPV